MKKRYWVLIGFFLVLMVTYFTGPEIKDPVYTSVFPELPSNLDSLDAHIKRSESQKALRKDNEARIIWYGDSVHKSDYSVVYLHGFAGSYRDGYPVNIHIADSLKANIFLSRWAGHGLKPAAALQEFNPENAWESAKEALVIGKKIGEKVIIMSTSTGGTLALKLAATYPDDIFALINLSPNIEDDVEGVEVLNSPWGYEIARLIAFGSEKKIAHEQPIASQYWDTVYPSKALVNLQVLVSTTMKEENFKSIQIPVLTLYYHENFFKEDEHVEIDDYPAMHSSLGTLDSLKRLVALKEPGTHFIGSDIKSENTLVVEKAIWDFLISVLKVANH